VVDRVSVTPVRRVAIAGERGSSRRRILLRLGYGGDDGQGIKHSNIEPALNVNPPITMDACSWSQSKYLRTNTNTSYYADRLVIYEICNHYFALDTDCILLLTASNVSHQGHPRDVQFFNPPRKISSSAQPFEYCPTTEILSLLNAT
jgi:hypothetical protein